MLLFFFPTKQPISATEVLDNNAYFEETKEKLAGKINDHLVRVSFSGSGPNKQERSDQTKERKPPPQQTESSGNKGQNLRSRQFPGQMSLDYNSQDSEFATAVAAAAFAIQSIEEAELKYQKEMRKSVEISRTKTLQDTMTGGPSSGGVTRRPSNKEAKKGEASMKKSMGQDQRTLESAFPSRYPNRASSIRPSTPADGYQNQKGSSSGHGTVETKADAWEKAQMKKILNRYEKTKSAILAWENEKKMQAKLKMERRKSELEQRKARNMQHYQSKQARIDQIAGGARAQVEEKRRNEESKVKEKVKKIRSTGKVPATCFCFTCY